MRLGKNRAEESPLHQFCSTFHFTLRIVFPGLGSTEYDEEEYDDDDDYEEDGGDKNETKNDIVLGVTAAKTAKTPMKKKKSGGHLGRWIGISDLGSNSIPELKNCLR